MQIIAHAPARKHKLQHALLDLLGWGLLLVAAFLLAILFFKHSAPLQAAYAAYQSQLLRLETQVLLFRETWRIALAVLVLYALRAFLPLFPISALCFITGVVLPLPLGFALHLVGLALALSIKYAWGWHHGGGSLQALLRLHPDVSAFWERKHQNAPWLLVVFRLVPSFPLNAVSQIYGASGFAFVDFLLLSLLGSCPKLLLYAFVGNHVFDPLSIPFLVPLVILFLLSGLSALCIHRLLR